MGMSQATAAALVLGGDQATVALGRARIALRTYGSSGSGEGSGSGSAATSLRASPPPPPLALPVAAAAAVHASELSQPEIVNISPYSSYSAAVPLPAAVAAAIRR